MVANLISDIAFYKENYPLKEHNFNLLVSVSSFLLLNQCFIHVSKYLRVGLAVTAFFATFFVKYCSHIIKINSQRAKITADNLNSPVASSILSS